MEKIQCEKCGKVIEGYSKKQIEYLLLQHNLTHRKENEKEVKKNG